jgi:predicted nucleic acid-binding protein
MIAYVDTSAPVKLFVTETNSTATRDVFHQVQVLGTGLMTRAELGAALARGSRGGLISAEEAARAWKELEVVWPTWVHVAVDEALIQRAEGLAWEHRLRGYGAVHLAAALTWQEQIGYSVTLATFDRELWEAAGATGLSAWPEGLAP